MYVRLWGGEWRGGARHVTPDLGYTKGRELDSTAKATL